MKRLRKELEAAFNDFEPEVDKQLSASKTQANGQLELFKKSYIGLGSIQAWRSELLDSAIAPEALAFFIEAQNDGVVSHVQARHGCWRPALQALRSMIENSYQMLYYKDHPIELKLWHRSKHRLNRKELESYLSEHPEFAGGSIREDGLTLLAKQYSCLNHAVHASAKSFRMTRDTTDLHISRYTPADASRWASNEREVLTGINLLFLAAFKDWLSGTRLPNLRKSISLHFTQKTRDKVKAELGIVLQKP